MANRQILLEMYEFSPQEAKQAQILPEINLQFIKTQLAFKTKERENLAPDPNNYSKFVQEDAHLRGMMDAYEFLIDCHVNVLEALKREIRETQQS